MTAESARPNRGEAPRRAAGLQGIDRDGPRISGRSRTYPAGKIMRWIFSERHLHLQRFSALLHAVRMSTTVPWRETQ